MSTETEAEKATRLLQQLKAQTAPSAEKKAEAPAGEPVAWQEYLGRRMLVRDIQSDEVFEVTPRETSIDGKYACFEAWGGTRVWKESARFAVVGELAVGLIDRIQASTAAVVATCNEQKERIANLEADNARLVAELDAEQKRYRPVEENARRILERMNAEHDETRQALAAARVERDAAKAERDAARAEAAAAKAEATRLTSPRRP